MKITSDRLSVLVAAVLSLASAAQAEVRRVPQAYRTISAAIAASFDGDVVEVGPGTYAEGLNFGGRDITVRSTAGAATTIVDPVSGRCLTATGQKGIGARLEGFTLRGGSASNGGGVYVSASSPVLVNCVITGNESTANNGGGVYVASGSPKLVGCTVSQNVAPYRGGGIYLESGSLTLENCVISGNEVPYAYANGTALGAGLYASSGTTVSITGGAIRGNRGGESGAGIYGGTLSITGCAIESNVLTIANSSGGGGGISNAVVTMTGGSVSLNDSTGRGGALSSVTGQISNCVLSGNSSVGDGGAVWSSGTLSLTGCTVEQNDAGGYGGTWYATGGTATLQTCQVKNNTAVTVGGVWVQGGTARVGGTTFCGNGVNINGAWTDLGGNIFQGSCDGSGSTTRRVPSDYASIAAAINASYDGDVVEVGPGTYAEGLNFGGRDITVRSTAGAATTIVDPVSGRCLTATGQKGIGARLEGFTLRGGSASNGGGVYVSASSPVLVNCVITGNESTANNGGGVYVASGSPKLVGCTVSQNVAPYRGGGIYLESGSLTLENCVISGNEVPYAYANGTALGAGLYASSGTTVSITGGAIRGNRGGESGAGIYGGTLSITGCAIESNVLTIANSSGGGGGISNAVVTMTGGSVSLNDSTGRGGALSSVTGQISNCVLSGNSSVGDGGAVWSSGTLSLTGCTVEQNDAGGYGGTWYATGGTATLQTCQVKNNTAVTVGGVWVQGGTARVGGTTFCGNGVNINGAWTDLGGNIFQGSCDGSGSTTRRVPSDYASIAAAINASYDGDVVEVGPGTYAEGLNFGGRDITVRSTAGAATTIVDPVSGRCLTATGQKGIGARLEGFTLRGGSASNGGGVYVSASSPVLVNCVITGNESTANNGGGVYVASGSPKLVGCTVSQNVAPYRGGGIYLESGSLTLENCVISGNEVPYAYANGTALGAGLYASSGTTVSITGGAIRGNRGGESGAGIYGGTLSITGCAIESNVLTIANSSGGGGGISNAVVTMTGGSVSLNDSTGRGGALSSVTGQISNCVLSGNSSVGDGGAVWSSGTLSLTGCTVEQNDAGGYGGTWYATGGTATLQTCQVKNNTAVTVGGVWVQGGTARAGGTTFCGNGVNINGAWTDLGGNIFQGSCDGSGSTTRRVPSDYASIAAAINASYDGDVVEVGPGTYAEGLNFGGRDITVRSTAGAATTIVDPVSGRCLTATGQKGIGARLEGFTLRGGSASNGGGVYVSASSPVLVNCVITGNESTANNGGGVYVASGSPKLVGCTVSQNVAPYRGGGIYLESGSLTLENCVISGNEVPYAYANGTALGAGLYASSGTTVSITGGAIRGNRGGESGAGIYGGTLSITGCAIESNVLTIANSSGGGGGISNAVVTMTGGSVSLNDSTGRGGALSSVTGQISNCVLSGNSSVGDGGAVWSSGTLSLTGCTVEQNDAGGYGGTWYATGGTATLQTCQVKNNTAVTVGGVWVQGGTARVGGTTFCGNGVNINGAWTDLGGNIFQGSCDGSGSTTRRVPSDYASIAAAINASYDGDVVEVGPGTYAEGLNFGGRDITVRSTAGAATTIVDPVSGRCLTATGQKGIGARLEGFTLRGGSASNGGGVYVSASSPVLVNCVITGNESTANNGGGVYVASGSPKLVGCTVSQNVAPYRGGGIYLESGSLTLENCVISGNEVPYAYANGTALGAGLYASSGTTVSITGGAIRGNRGGESGAGIYGGTLSITGCAIESNVLTIANSSGGGGGISNAVVTMTGGSVSLNDSTGRGGALSSVTGQISNCVLSGNSSVGDGGAVWSSGTLSLTGCTVEQNDAGGYGGTWYATGGTATLQTCQVKNNTAVTVGGVWVQGGTARVGGTTFCGNGVNINGAWTDLGGNIFQGSCDGSGSTTRRVPSDYASIAAAINASYDGDVVEVGPGTYAEGLNFGGRDITVRSTAGAATTIVDPVSGRCLTATGQKGIGARLEGFTLRGGSASNGGGVYVSASSPVLVNCVITGNESTANNGGGVYVASGSPKLVGCTVSQNVAPYRGGGIYLESGSLTLENCVISGNEVPYAYANGTALGAGLYASSGTTVSITGGAIRGNRGGESGAGIYGGTLSITGCAIESNVLTIANSSGGGGGISNAVVTMTGGSVSLNDSTGRGGALSSVTGQISNCVLSGNSSVGDGGAVWSSGTLSLTGCTVEQNDAGGYGGTWYATGGTATLQTCQVKNNTAVTVGGVWVQGGTARVGGTTFCGNGVNINGAWTDLGGNELNGQCPPYCIGDGSGNAIVDGLDLGLTLSRWGVCEGDACYSDFNGDGIINGADLGEVLSHWGRCPGW